MSLINCYKHIPKKYLSNPYYNPNPLLPQHPFRMLICGASNTGKTNTLLNVVDQSQNFHKIYLLSKKLDEPLYQFLIDTWLKKSKKLDAELIFTSNDINDTPTPDDLDESIQNLIIFDDMITERNLSKVSELFIRGRKSNCSLIFITQSYFDVPMQVRVNSDYFIFTRNLRGNALTQVAKDHSGSLSIEEFKNLYRKSTSQGCNFFMIDNNTKLEEYRLRRNFDYSLISNKFIFS